MISNILACSPLIRRTLSSTLRYVAYAALISAEMRGQCGTPSEGAVPAEKLIIQFSSSGETGGAQPLRLIGADARQQVLVTAELPGDGWRDLTRQVTYGVSPGEVVRVSQTGLITPIADGTATVTARTAAGLEAS